MEAQLIANIRKHQDTLATYPTDGSKPTLHVCNRILNAIALLARHYIDQGMTPSAASLKASRA